MSDSNEAVKYDLMPADQRAAVLSKEDSVFLNVAKFEQMQRVASMLSASDFVPSRFRGKVGNCMIALDMAALMGMHVLMLMRTMYVVHGEPGFEGKFVSALINNSKRYTDPLEYEWRGEKGRDDWGCRAFAVRRSTGKVIYGPWVDWAMVKAEGWNKPRGDKQMTPKWVTMPEIMFMYRAATFFGRVHDSDLLMGMRTVEELEDMHQELVKQADGSFAMTAPESEKKADLYAVTKEAPGPVEGPDKGQGKAAEGQKSGGETEDGARTRPGAGKRRERGPLTVPIRSQASAARSQRARWSMTSSGRIWIIRSRSTSGSTCGRGSRSAGRGS
ncbi:hypothetical protein [Desulfatitalea tepidiphila]|uniref:hypothetical protein n=1 Tax=Desulfatitalea tepidiphila TaxID=1185843 RepID=UPI0006B5E68B|nr:hypothetical protein [Desulfatitalea tepidiphila]